MFNIVKKLIVAFDNFIEAPLSKREIKEIRDNIQKEENILFRGITARFSRGNVLLQKGEYSYRKDT